MNCQICGKEFVGNTRGNPKFCKDCRNEAHRRRSKKHRERRKLGLPSLRRYAAEPTITMYAHWVLKCMGRVKYHGPKDNLAVEYARKAELMKRIGCTH